PDNTESSPWFPLKMDKLDERESATRSPLAAAPALAVQFFLIPLTVVAVTVAVYVGFRSMLADDRSPKDYLAEIQNGGSDRRWPAAYELSRLMSNPKVRADKTLAPALVKAFRDSKNDPDVRRYLALAIGRLDPPLPSDAIADLTQALDDPDSQTRISVIWALGSSGDEAVVSRLVPLYQAPDADPGIKKMIVYALGALPGDAQIDTLRTALQDSTPDVRWNAAVALARHGRSEGAAVLHEMLDRAYVERTVKRDVRQDEDQDPIADVMISGIRAGAAIRDASLKPAIETLSHDDRSMKVRQAALEALRQMG
ncbi:MAG TPA: HEAT repeat domain-containing protein, partial [Vicinamibacterales bacterium]|nr:HEAT repeat domain-containing protein [Vicinamibacterales bacterium]